MPEGLEAEIYRRAAEPVVGRRIAAVDVDDRQPMAVQIPSALVGAAITGTGRIGKVVLLDLDEQAAAGALALHFGMTGRLVVDGDAPIPELAYSSGRDDAAWDRLRIEFDDGGVLRVNDPRRWARFTLDLGTDGLGPDFLDVTASHLIERFARRRAPVKAVLLDQSVVAGYGNLCVDEVLWQSGIAPGVPARDVPPECVERLVELARPHLLEMLEMGGSHRGVIDPAVRAALPPCPRDGATLRRERVAGRTTVWCPLHQQASGSRPPRRGTLGSP